MSESLKQLSRVYSVSVPSAEVARALIAASPATLADALFNEAAASDDVTGVPSALAYCDARLGVLGDLISGGARAMVLERFRARIASWEG